MYFKHLPHISLVLALLITTQNIYTSEHPKQNAQTIETVLPNDIWSQIAMYVPAHPFINEIARKKQLSQDVYNKMIKSYIKNTCNDYFSKDEIDTIIKKHFNTKFIPKDKIRKALEAVAAANPLANYKQLIDSGDLDKLDRQISYKFPGFGNLLRFAHADALEEVLSKLAPDEILNVYKNIMSLNKFLVHAQIYVSNPNGKLYNALKKVSEKIDNTSERKAPLIIGSSILSIYCILWVQFLCNHWEYLYNNPDDYDNFLAGYIAGLDIQLSIDQPVVPAYIFMSGLIIYLMTEFVKVGSKEFVTTSGYSDASIWLESISENVHQLRVYIDSYIGDHHPGYSSIFQKEYAKCHIYSMNLRQLQQL